eukprot:Gb_21369 [translate_table: standard]
MNEVYTYSDQSIIILVLPSVQVSRLDSCSLTRRTGNRTCSFTVHTF